MSNSKRKMDVLVGPSPWGKTWVKVILKNSRTFYPSFEDLHRIIQAIAYCEEMKYPGGEGRLMIARFLFECAFQTSFSDLAKEFNIPIRDNTEIVDSNGSSVKENIKANG